MSEIHSTKKKYISLNELGLDIFNSKTIIDEIFRLYEDSHNRDVEIRFPQDLMDPLYFDCITELEKRMNWENSGVIAKHEKAHHHEIIRLSESSMKIFGFKNIWLESFPGMIGLRQLGSLAYPKFAILHGGNYPEDVSQFNIPNEDKSKINLFVFQARILIALAPRDDQIEANDMDDVAETLIEAHKLGMLLDCNIHNVKEKSLKEITLLK